jgi:hypothetical protein
MALLKYLVRFDTERAVGMTYNPNTHVVKVGGYARFTSEMFALINDYFEAQKITTVHTARNKLYMIGKVDLIKWHEVMKKIEDDFGKPEILTTMGRIMY